MIHSKMSDELVQQLVAGKSPEEIAGKGGLLEEMTKRLYQAALKGEMDDHLGYQKHDRKGYHSGNSRNGYTTKKLKTESGELSIDVPRDRNGTFEPKLIEKGSRRTRNFETQVISFYSKGMTTRMIRDHLEEFYGTEVSATLVSNVIEAIMPEVIEWQNRQLEACYPILFLDGMHVKVRVDGRVISKVAYQVLGIDTEGYKHLLGMWLQETEGANFWLTVLTELRSRGVEDVFIVCVDGLIGLPEAVEAVFPKVEVQQCIVHMVRSSAKHVATKDRKVLCHDLKEVYTAPTKEKAKANLDVFAQKWDAKYPIISKSWRERWEHLSVFFQYPPPIRRQLYTTNAIEAINRVFRKAVKTRTVFPHDEAVRKLFYLTVRNISKNWSKASVPHWQEAAAIFAIKYPDRFPNPFSRV